MRVRRCLAWVNFLSGLAKRARRPKIREQSGPWIFHYIRKRNSKYKCLDKNFFLGLAPDFYSLLGRIHKWYIQIAKRVYRRNDAFTVIAAEAPAALDSTVHIGITFTSNCLCVFIINFIINLITKSSNPENIHLQIFFIIYI